jgi:hypothetical protein
MFKEQPTRLPSFSCAVEQSALKLWYRPLESCKVNSIVKLTGLVELRRAIPIFDISVSGPENRLIPWLCSLLQSNVSMPCDAI